MSQRYLLLIATIALVVIGAIFPTPHTRTVEDLVETLDCEGSLEDGESLSVVWTNMQGNTKIVVSILSNEDVQVLLTGINSESYTFYSLSQKTHGVEHTREYPSYNVTVWNPTWSGYGCDVCTPVWSDDGSSAEMTGSIEAYHVYEIQEWLPWWMA